MSVVNSLTVICGDEIDVNETSSALVVENMNERVKLEVRSISDTSTERRRN